jgi:hypothetical protein
MSAHGQDLICGERRRVVTELVATRYDLAAAGFGCYAERWCPKATRAASCQT